MSYRPASSRDRKWCEQLVKPYPHMIYVVGQAAFNPHRRERALVWEVDGERAGYAVISRNKAGVTTLECIIIDPKYRGRGIGRAMVAKLPQPLRFVVEADIEHEPLARWYCSLGYRVVETCWKRDRSGRIHKFQGRFHGEEQAEV